MVSSRGAGPQEWSGHTGKREKLDLSASEWTLRKLLNTYIIKTLRETRDHWSWRQYSGTVQREGLGVKAGADYYQCTAGV